MYIFQASKRSVNIRILSRFLILGDILFLVNNLDYYLYCNTSQRIISSKMKRPLENTLVVLNKIHKPDLTKISPASLLTHPSREVRDFIKKYFMEQS